LSSLELSFLSTESTELSSSSSAEELSSLPLSLESILFPSTSLFKPSTYSSAFSNSPSASTIKSLIASSSFIHSGAFSLNRDFLEETPEELGLTVGSYLSEGLKCSRGLAIGSDLSKGLAVVEETDGLDLSNEGISFMQTNC
jgi:hypothetical protein